MCTGECLERCVRSIGDLRLTSSPRTVPQKQAAAEKVHEASRICISLLSCSQSAVWEAGNIADTRAYAGRACICCHASWLSSCA